MVTEGFTSQNAVMQETDQKILTSDQIRQYQQDGRKSDSR